MQDNRTAGARQARDLIRVAFGPALVALVIIAAVVGGMSAATILGLFFVPVLFALLARKRQ